MTSSVALPAPASSASLRRMVLTSGARTRPSTRPTAAGGTRAAPPPPGPPPRARNPRAPGPTPAVRFERPPGPVAPGTRPAPPPAATAWIHPPHSDRIHTERLRDLRLVGGAEPDQLPRRQPPARLITRVPRERGQA